MKHILPFLVAILFLGCTKKPASEIHPEVQILYDKSIALLDTDPDSSYYFAEKLLEVACKKDDGFGIAQSHYIMGYLQKNHNEAFDSAVIHYLKAYEATKNYEFEKKFQIRGSVLMNCGLIFDDFEAFRLAERFLLESLTVSKNHVQEKVSKIDHNISILRLSQGEFDKAFQIVINYKDSFETESHREKQRLLILQQCYFSNNNFDSTISVGNKILGHNDTNYFGNSPTLMALSFAKMGNIDSSISYFDNALRYHNAIELDAIGYTYTALEYSKLYFEKGDYNRSKSILLKASVICDTTNSSKKNSENFFEVYQVLSELYEKTGDHDIASKYYALYRQELYSYTKLHQKYDFNKIVEDFYNNLEEEKRSKEIKNYAYLGSLSLLLLLGGVFGATQYRTYRTRKKLDQTTTEKRLAELKALKAQINPHFLFNALNSIQSYILEDKHDVAESYLVKYGKLMRKILDHSDELTVTLQEELEALKLYVELEQIRVNGGFEFHVSLDESLDPYTTYVPSMVIQPFLENAIWHGVSKMVGKGVVTLDILQKEGWIEVVVTDNGVGYDMKTPTNSASKGVNLVRERLELLEKTEGLTAVADMKSEVGVGMKVILRFSKDLK